MEHAASEAKALQAKCTELQALIEAQRKEGEAKIVTSGVDGKVRFASVCSLCGV